MSYCNIEYIKSLPKYTNEQKSKAYDNAKNIWNSLKSAKNDFGQKLFVVNSKKDLVPVKDRYAEAVSFISNLNKQYGYGAKGNVVRTLKKSYYQAVQVSGRRLSHKEMLIEQAKAQQEADASRAGVDYTDNYLFQLESKREGSIADLNSKMISFLNALGVKVDNLDNYAEQYKDRTGKEFDGVALADMTNKLVLVKSGQIKIDTLPEEAAHFAIEALGYDHPIIKSLLKRVDKTNTYSDVLERYSGYEAYQNEDGTVNYDKIKVEALGKILADVVINNYNSDSSVLQSFKDLLAKAWNLLMSKFKPNDSKVVYDNIAQSLNSIAADMIVGNMEGYNADNIGEALFYQDNVSKTEKDLIDDMVEDGRNVELQKEGDTSFYVLNGLKIERQSNFKARILNKNTNYDDKSKYNLMRGAVIGNLIDIMARDIFDGKISSYESHIKEADELNSWAEVKLNISKELYDGIVAEMIAVRDRMIEDGFTFVSKDLFTYTKFSKEEQEKTGFYGMGGMLDLLAIDKNGKKHIVDFKNTKYNERYFESGIYGPSQFETKMESWSDQQTLYSELMKVNGVDIDSINILSFATEYGDVVDGVLTIDSATLSSNKIELKSVSDIDDSIIKLGYNNKAIDKFRKALPKDAFEKKDDSKGRTEESKRAELRLRQAIKQIENRIEKLSKTKSSEATQAKLSEVKKKLINDLENKQFDLGLTNFINHAVSNSDAALKFIRDYRANKGKPISLSLIKDLEEYIEYYGELITDIRFDMQNENILYNSIKSLDPDTFKKVRDKYLGDLANIVVNFHDVNKFFEEQRSNLSEQTIRKESLADSEETIAQLKYNSADINLVQKWFQSLSSATSDLMSIIDSIVLKAKMKTNRFTLDRGNTLFALKEKHSLTNEQLESLMERDDEGNKTGFLVSKFKLGVFSAARKKFYNDLIEKYGLSKDKSARELEFENNPILKSEWIKAWREWSKENTKPMKDWEKIVEQRREQMSPNQFKIWYNDNVSEWQSPKNGQILKFPKNELIEPSDKYLNQRFLSTVNVAGVKEMYDKLLEMRREDLSKLPSIHRSNINLFKLPQSSKSIVERAKLKGGVLNQVKELAKDTFFSRVDDDMFAGNLDLNDGKTKQKYVPIRYTDMLENPNDISDDLIGMYVLYGNMAENFKNISEVLPEVDNLKNAVGKSQFTRGGKTIEGLQSNTYEAISTYIDMHVYEESKEKFELKIPKEVNGKKVPVIGGRVINVSKIANKLLAYIRASNLVGSVFTSLTGFLTGSVFSTLEMSAGRYTTMKSGRWAFGEFVKNFGHVVGDAGNANKKNLQQNVFELHNVFKNGKETFKDGNKSKIGKFINDNLFYGLYSLGDFAVKGVMTLSVFDNYRYYDGKFISHAEFMNTYFKGEWKKGNKEWDSIQDKSYYNAWEMKDNKPVVKEGFNVTEEDINLMTSRVNHLNSKVDGQLTETDRTKVVQNIFGQFLWMHKNWITTGFTDRFKGKGVNYHTGEEEEGFYRSVLRNPIRFLKAVYQPNLKRYQFENWQDLSDYERANLMKSIAEMRAITITMMAYLFFNKLADDDDDEDNYFLQSAAYLTSRMLLEEAAFFGIYPTYKEFRAILDRPVAGVSTLDSISDLWNLFDDKEIKYGAYKGMNKGQRGLIKLLPGVRGLVEATDPSSKNKFLRTKALDWVPFGG